MSPAAREAEMRQIRITRPKRRRERRTDFAPLVVRTGAGNGAVDELLVRIDELLGG